MTRQSRKALFRARRSHNRKENFHRAAKAVGNVFFVSLMILIASMLFILVQSKLNGGQAKFAGYQLYTVLSGSMNPAFDTGSLVVVKQVDPAILQEGNIIAFNGHGGRLISHRIVGIDLENGLSFITKGDANAVADSGAVSGNQVIGTVQFAIPFLGRLLAFSQTKQGLLTLIIIPALAIIILEGRELLSYALQLDKEKKAKSVMQN